MGSVPQFNWCSLVLIHITRGAGRTNLEPADDPSREKPFKCHRIRHQDRLHPWNPAAQLSHHNKNCPHTYGWDGFLCQLPSYQAVGSELPMDGELWPEPTYCCHLSAGVTTPLSPPSLQSTLLLGIMWPRTHRCKSQTHDDLVHNWVTNLEPWWPIS
jgi:hypothetical protein